jgi:hypothetical protein
VQLTADDFYDRLDAYTMGRAAEMLGTTQGFPRAIGEARLITPLRSAGGHRRYCCYAACTNAGVPSGAASRATRRP